jgi:uncharacterized membrane protein YfcA
VVGAVSGATLAVELPEHLLPPLIGAALVTTGLVVLITSRIAPRPRWGILALFGGAAAFDKALSGGGYGPLMMGGQLIGGIDAKAAVVITSVAEVFICIVGLTTYTLDGWLVVTSLVTPMVLGAMVAAPVSASLVKIAPEKLLRRSVGVLTIALGAATLGTV